MNADSYQDAAQDTAIYGQSIATAVPIVTTRDMERLLRLSYAVNGLVGEAGELANKLKKIIRDNGCVIGAGHEEQLADELGDVQWYVAMVAGELGYNLSEIMTENVAKLRDRQLRQVLGGSGDDR